MATDNEKTGAFDVSQLKQERCPDCAGSGQQHFEVEKQTVITPCPRCAGKGFLPPG
jgi:DnaJ-class molecular chaperone